MAPVYQTHICNAQTSVCDVCVFPTLSITFNGLPIHTRTLTWPTTKGSHKRLPQKDARAESQGRDDVDVNRLFVAWFDCIHCIYGYIAQHTFFTHILSVLRLTFCAHFWNSYVCCSVEFLRFRTFITSSGQPANIQTYKTFSAEGKYQIVIKAID